MRRPGPEEEGKGGLGGKGWDEVVGARVEEVVDGDGVVIGGMDGMDEPKREVCAGGEMKRGGLGEMMFREGLV